MNNEVIDLCEEPQTLFDFENCPICMEKSMESRIFGGNCGHAICKTCFEKMTSLGLNKCPLCRASFYYSIDVKDETKEEDEVMMITYPDEQELIFYDSPLYLDDTDWKTIIPQRFPYGGGRCYDCRILPTVSEHGCICQEKPICKRCHKTEENCIC